MTLESAITFLVAVFLFSITPGPGVLAIIARGQASGTVMAGAGIYLIARS